MVPMKLYYGIVENVDDPLKLGRCKVRVIGVHTDDRQQLPISDLPWATPIQGVTSAALSGIGESPTGLLQGSTVIVVFVDGDSLQVPIILGSIAGIPQNLESEQYISGDSIPQVLYQTGDNVVPTDDSGNPVQTSEQGGGFVAPTIEPTANFIGPLSSDDYLKYRETIGKRESQGYGGYNAVNTINYLGKYQFGAGKLQDYGYVTKGTTQKDIKNNSHWTGKNGIHSYLDFLKNHDVQDACMELMTKNNYKTLQRKGILRNDSDKNHCTGLLAVAHLKGAGDAISYGRGQPVNPDAYGTSAASYYKLGYSSLEGEVPKILPSDDSSLPENVAIQTATKGFSDPNGVYPVKKYLREPDTSRLIRAQGISSTVVGKKEASRTRSIRVANSGTVWDQPHIPYAAVYPHNKAKTTENGLVEEFDDTPGAIRYHLYHPAGTFTEIDNNGTKVNRIIGDNYEIIDRNGYVYVKGDCNITIEGNAKILVQEQCDLEVYGDCNAVYKNNLNQTVHGTLNTFVQEDVNINCRNFNVNTFNGDINLVSEKSFKSYAKNDILLETETNLGTKSGEKTILESANDLSIKSDTKLISESGTEFSIKSGANLNIDGTEIHMQEGASIGGQLVKDTIKDSAIGNNGGSIIEDHVKNPLGRQEVVESNISQIVDPPSYIDSMNSVYESPDDGDISTSYSQDITDTYISIGEVEMADNFFKTPTSTQDFNTINSVKGQPVDCSIFINETDIPMGMQLSENFSLKQLCSSQLAPKKIVVQHGVSPGQLVCNLKHLAVNILEPVKAKYPDIIITSGLRKSGAGQILDSSKKTVSKHEVGMAVDIQFGPSFRPSDYYDIAKDLATFLDYDQLILEHSNNFKTAWIHIGYNSNGNRKELYTYNNQKKYKNGLHKLV